MTTPAKNGDGDGNGGCVRSRIDAAFVDDSDHGAVVHRIDANRHGHEGRRGGQAVVVLNGEHCGHFLLVQIHDGNTVGPRIRDECKIADINCKTWNKSVEDVLKD